MLTVLVATLATLLYGTLAGWVVHWTLHQKWMGRFYKAHLVHHLDKYPKNNLLSKVYRKAGKDDSTIMFIPPVTGLFLLFAAGLWSFGVPLVTYPVILTVGVVVGILHELIHQSFHIEGHWLLKYRWYQKLRADHFVHHWNMRKNLGILWFGWDRLFGTFKSWTRK